MLTIISILLMFVAWVFWVYCLIPKWNYAKANRVRCPWVNVDGDQCYLDQGHTYLCKIVYTRGSPSYWYGINYPNGKPKPQAL